MVTCSGFALAEDTPTAGTSSTVVTSSIGKSKDWFQLPDDKGGLVLVISGDVKDRKFTIDDNTAMLASKVWGFTRR